MMGGWCFCQVDRGASAITSSFPVGYPELSKLPRLIRVQSLDESETGDCVKDVQRRKV